MVWNVTCNIKTGKAAGPSWIIMGMIKTIGETTIDQLTIYNYIVQEGAVPKD